MRSLLSSSAMLKILSSLYEQDFPKPETEKAMVKPVGAKANARAPRKKKEKSDYIKDEKDADDKDEESEEDEAYNSVFVSKSKDGEYAIKAGHANLKMKGNYEKMPHITIYVPSPSPEESAVKSKLYEAKAILNQISYMVSDTALNDTAYLDELNGSTTASAGGLRSSRNTDVVKIEYADPVFINNQWTYQRIFMKSDADGPSIYEFTINKARSTGTDAKVRYDGDFNSFYFESLNGAKDGHNGAYWEAWVNGNIVEEALDKKELKKGDVVEWRLANERESYCGGGGEERFIRPELRSRASNPLGLPITETAYLSRLGLPGAFGNVIGQPHILSQNYISPGYGGLR